MHNPNYDPDDDGSGTSKYWNGVYSDTDEQRLREHGDQYMSGWKMQQRHIGARQEKKTHEDGTTAVVWTIPGE